MMMLKHKIFGWFLFCMFSAVAMITPRNSFADDYLDKIKADLHSMDWQSRLAAVEKLDKRNDEKALNMLLDVASTWTEYWPVKVKAIQLLGEARYAKAVELLLSIFNNPFLNWKCPSIKSYTALALGNFKGNQEVLDTLIDGVDDDELLIREASIRSLGKIGDTKAVPHLVRLLGDRSIAIRLSVIKALEGIGDPRSIPDIQRILESETDSVVKTEAAAALNNFHVQVRNKQT
jgi:HEAT repeat protein